MKTTTRKDKSVSKAGTRARAKAAAPAVKASSELAMPVSEPVHESVPEPVLEPAVVAAVGEVVEPLAEQSASAAPVITLSSHCMLKDAAALKAQLIALAHAAEPVAIDVAAVERIDTATLQILCAFSRDRAARQQQVQWRGDSRSWNEAVRLLGVGQLIGVAHERRAV